MHLQDRKQKNAATGFRGWSWPSHFLSDQWREQRDDEAKGRETAAGQPSPPHDVGGQLQQLSRVFDANQTNPCLFNFFNGRDTEQSLEFPAEL